MPNRWIEYAISILGYCIGTITALDAEIINMIFYFLANDRNSCKKCNAMRKDSKLITF